MPITVDWPTSVITIPQSYMTALGGGVYQLDIDQVRLDLRDLEAQQAEGAAWPYTHDHNTEQVISGITFARGVVFLDPYTIAVSPAGGWIVSCTGANHNMQDIYSNLTGPTLLPNLTAGLVVTGVSGLTVAESAALLGIEADVATIQTDIGFIRVDQAMVNKILRNRKITYKSGPNAGKMIIFDDDGTTVLLEALIYEDDQGLIPYRGSGAERQERLE